MHVWTYQIVPFPTTELSRARAHILEAQPGVEINEMIVSKQSKSFRTLRVLDTLNVCFHQDRSKTNLLMLLCYGDRVNTHCSTPFLMADWLIPSRDRQRRFPCLPIRWEAHTRIGDTWTWTSRGNNVADQTSFWWLLLSLALSFCRS